jgi:hypothetical protein
MASGFEAARSYLVSSVLACFLDKHADPLKGLRQSRYPKDHHCLVNDGVRCVEFVPEFSAARKFPSRLVDAGFYAASEFSGDAFVLLLRHGLYPLVGS